MDGVVFSVESVLAINALAYAGSRSANLLEMVQKKFSGPTPGVKQKNAPRRPCYFDSCTMRCATIRKTLPVVFDDIRPSFYEPNCITCISVYFQIFL